MEMIRPEDYKPNFSGVSPYDLYLISKRFDCYIKLKGFCDFNKIPYSLVFEGNA